MVVNIFVFTSPTCIHCHNTMNLLKSLDRKDVVIQEVSTATKEGLELARKNNIMALPTTFITGDKSKEIIGLKGTPSLKEINKAIDLCSGG